MSDVGECRDQNAFNDLMRKGLGHGIPSSNRVFTGFMGKLKVIQPTYNVPKIYYVVLLTLLTRQVALKICVRLI